MEGIPLEHHRTDKCTTVLMLKRLKQAVFRESVPTLPAGYKDKPTWPQLMWLWAFPFFSFKSI